MFSQSVSLLRCHLCALQSVVGGPSAFEPFMRAYLDAFAFKTVTSEQFKDFFMDYFKDNKAGDDAC